MTEAPFRVGFLLFPNLTQLDLTGPWEVFARVPQSEVHLVWKDMDPVTADGGMRLLPSATLADAPPFDLICVPGGPGQVAMMEDGCWTSCAARRRPRNMSPRFVPAR